jgi:SAM-dependent methyltransferase
MLLRYEAAVALNKSNIRLLVRDRPYSSICDLGCDDGEWTVEVGESANAEKLFGLDIVVDRLRSAARRGIHVTVSDLSQSLPYVDECFDLVHANQVIEHVSDLDRFLAEAKRVLRVGGTLVISTENGSSWHNIVAAIMGWQIFSSTNISMRAMGVGNPLALHRGSALSLSSWTHKTILNYRGLIELLRVHGFGVVRVLGAGYHPLPALLGRLDVRHAHFVAVRATRK